MNAAQPTTVAHTSPLRFFTGFPFEQSVSNHGWRLTLHSSAFQVQRLQRLGIWLSGTALLRPWAPLPVEEREWLTKLPKHNNDKTKTTKQ